MVLLVASQQPLPVPQTDHVPENIWQQLSSSGGSNGSIVSCKEDQYTSLALDYERHDDSHMKLLA